MPVTLSKGLPTSGNIMNSASFDRPKHSFIHWTQHIFVFTFVSSNKWLFPFDHSYSTARSSPLFRQFQCRTAKYCVLQEQSRVKYFDKSSTKEIMSKEIMSVRKSGSSSFDKRPSTFLVTQEKWETSFNIINTWWIIVNEAATVLNLIAMALLVSEIWLSTDR